MAPDETFGQLLGYVKALRVMEARLEAGSSSSVLKVDERTSLWAEEITRAGATVTCHDRVEPI